MRDVLLLADQLRRPVPGGIATYVRGLLRGLDTLAAGPEPAPAVALYAGRGRRADDIGESGHSVVESVLPTALLTKAWDLGLVDVPRRFGIVHAASLATPPSRHAALVSAIHDTLWRVVPEAFPARGRRWHEAALRRALRRADAVVVPVPSLVDELRQEAVAPERIAVIPLGCDHFPAADTEGAARVLAEHGVRGDYILTVGTLEPRKNLPRLVSAFERAEESVGEQFALVIVGPSGWGTDGLGAAAPGAAHAGKVVLLGAVGPALLAALYERARLLAYVPLAEGYGLPPVEAMHLGVPVVTSPVPSVQGAARRGAVVEVDPLDVEAIADALVRVANDDETRAGLVSSGREIAAGRTWAAAARAHVELWAALS